jgi:uncharacterized membrane protein (Fun14 family)
MHRHPVSDFDLAVALDLSSGRSSSCRLGRGGNLGIALGRADRSRLLLLLLGFGGLALRLLPLAQREVVRVGQQARRNELLLHGTVERGCNAITRE